MIRYLLSLTLKTEQAFTLTKGVFTLDDYVCICINITVTVYGPVYTKRQRQRCDYFAMMLAILFSLKSMETLENGLQTHSGASLQSCTTTLHFIWSNIADASLTLGMNGPLRSLNAA